MPSALTADAVGPVDIAVVTFDGNQFTGEIAPALADLQASGIIHIIDLAFVIKDEAGNAAFVEVGDTGVAAAFAPLGEDQLDLLSDDDLLKVATELEPNTSALVLVWENTWAARAAAAMRAANGSLAGLMRIPHDVVAAALESLEEQE